MRGHADAGRGSRFLARCDCARFRSVKALGFPRSNMIQKVLHFQFLENFVYEYLLALLIIVCGVLLVNWLLNFFLKRLSEWYKKS